MFHIQCVVEIIFNCTSLMYYRQFIVWIAGMVISENWLTCLPKSIQMWLWFWRRMLSGSCRCCQNVFQEIHINPTLLNDLLRIYMMWRLNYYVRIKIIICESFVYRSWTFICKCINISQINLGLLEGLCAEAYLTQTIFLNTLLCVAKNTVVMS